MMLDGRICLLIDHHTLSSSESTIIHSYIYRENNIIIMLLLNAFLYPIYIKLTFVCTAIACKA